MSQSEIRPPLGENITPERDLRCKPRNINLYFYLFSGFVDFYPNESSQTLQWGGLEWEWAKSYHRNAYLHPFQELTTHYLSTYLLVDNQSTFLTYIEIHPEVKIELPSNLQHFFLVISNYCITTSNDIRITYCSYIHSSDWNSIWSELWEIKTLLIDFWRNPLIGILEDLTGEPRWLWNIFGTLTKIFRNSSPFQGEISSEKHTEVWMCNLRFK